MIRGLPVLFIAFFLSGASGLIYQTVWVRMLTRQLGATSHATATVLAVFMAGLAAGSFLGGRWADRGKRLLVTYAGLEIAIALAAIGTSFLGIPFLSPVYVAAYRSLGGSDAVLLSQTLFAIACMLPPTLLMGATLPVLTVFLVRVDPRFERSFALLYSMNTWGAVAGVAATGYVLLGLVGETYCLWIAVFANVAAALLALQLRHLGTASSTSPSEVPESAATSEEAWTPYPLVVRRLVLVTLFASGLTALAYEVLWTRLLTPILETSIYAFSGMLATFLFGIAWGSLSAAREAKSSVQPLYRLATLELWIGTLAVIALILLPWIDPLGRAAGVDLTMLSLRNWIWKAISCVVILLPLAYCFGKQFPVAVRCFLADVDQPGFSTGKAYAINTLGAITGAFAGGFLLIPLLGSAKAMVVLAVLNVALGIVLFAVMPGTYRRSIWQPIALVVVFVIGAVSMGDPYLQIMMARLSDESQLGPNMELYHYSENSAGTTIAAGVPDEPRRRALLVNSVAMTNLGTETKLMAHLPYVLAKEPKRVLVICFGMGTTVRSASRHAELEIDAVDLAPAVFETFGYFHKDAQQVAESDHVRFHAQDGRHFLLVTESKFDVINVDAAPPLHSAGTVNLYSKEFFNLCKTHLTPTGVFCLWLPPSNESEIKMIMRTFLEVFPGASLWGGLESPGFYLIGGHRDFDLTPDERTEVAKRLAAIEDLHEWTTGYSDPQKLEELYIFAPKELERFVAESPVVTDDHPLTEFPLWRRIFVPSAKRILHANKIREALKTGH